MRAPGDAAGKAWGCPVIDDDLVKMTAFIVEPGARRLRFRRTLSSFTALHSSVDNANSRASTVLLLLNADAAAQKRPRADEGDGDSADRPEKLQRTADGAAAVDHAAATAGTSAADAAGDEAAWAAEAAAAAAGGGGELSAVRPDLEPSLQESVLYLGELRDIPGATEELLGSAPESPRNCPCRVCVAARAASGRGP